MTRHALAIVMIAACGDDPVLSGVARDTPVAELTSADVQQWCDWAIAEQGGFGLDHRCMDGTTITTDSVARCVDTLADLTCTDAIGELEDCIVATDGDPCLFPTESACAAYVACFP
jgi:hypothetical protein